MLSRNCFKLSNYNTRCVLQNVVKITKITLRNYTPRRAMLYVPGDSERKIHKAFNLNVDCIALDCEDAIALNKKDEARQVIKSVLDKGKPETAKFDLAVRVNSVQSGLCNEDVIQIFSAKNLPDSILLPKVDSVDDLKAFAGSVKSCIKKHSKINLIMLIESAISMINLPEICKYSREVSPHIVPCALVFGSDDFCANIGASRTDNSIEILYARQKVVVAATAFDLQAIDMVDINYKDLNTLKNNCEEGMRMGYTGKQVIHPDQVPIVQTAFIPSEKQILWATDLIKAFDDHQKKGIGAFSHKNKMIDMPTVRQATNIMKLARSIHKTKI